MSKNLFAIVGGTTLMGKELREVFEALPNAIETSLIGTEAGESVGLIEDAGEAVVVGALDEENLGAADAVLLAGDAVSSRRAWDLLAPRKPRPLVIDLNGALSQTPGAQARAPVVEPDTFEVEEDAPQVIAHPATIALALLLRRALAAGRVERAIVHAFLPASEQGDAGLDELHQQTIKLFAFEDMPKMVYDAQLAFSLLAALGADADAGKLSKLESEVREELPRILPAASEIPVSLRIIQAPVFHGLSFSVWLHGEAARDSAALAQNLRGDLVDIWPPENGVPNNVSAVGDAGISIGDIRADAASSDACWLWMTADNLRLRAVNALGAARTRLS